MIERLPGHTRQIIKGFYCPSSALTKRIVLEQAKRKSPIAFLAGGPIENVREHISLALFRFLGTMVRRAIARRRKLRLDQMPLQFRVHLLMKDFCNERLESKSKRIYKCFADELIAWLEGAGKKARLGDWCELALIQGRLIEIKPIGLFSQG